MGLLDRLFKSDPASVYKTCIQIYGKAIAKRPGKDERDYLKLVLLTKPPFDYQSDMVIEEFLNEHDTIEDLAAFIAAIVADPKNRDTRTEAFRIRERNIRERPFIKERNQRFFEEFWG